MPVASWPFLSPVNNSGLSTSVRSNMLDSFLSELSMSTTYSSDNPQVAEWTSTNSSHHPAAAALSCSQYVRNISEFIDVTFNRPNHHGNKSEAQITHEMISYVLNHVASPIMCLFGIMGNILNLIVMTRKQLQCTMDRMEKSAHLGLVGLAVSDALFCLLYFLASLTKNDRVVYTNNERIVVLYYNIYHEPLTNIFLLSSTWLTVIMALGRYIAICHPFRARGFINLPGMRAAICAVFVGSILANLPKFWHYYAMSLSCDVVQEISDVPLPLTIDPITHTVRRASCECFYYIKATGSLYKNGSFLLAYGLCWSIVGIFLPLIILTVCNVCLIRALRQSYQMQKRYRATRPRDSGHHITPTLVTIIILFTILVSPSEILSFFKRHFSTSETPIVSFMAFKSANDVANFLLLCNFSVNFVLYCVINMQFRKIVRDLVCCSRCKRKTKMEYYFKSSSHASTVMCNLSDFETEV